MKDAYPPIQHLAYVGMYRHPLRSAPAQFAAGLEVRAARRRVGRRALCVTQPCARLQKEASGVSPRAECGAEALASTLSLHVLVGQGHVPASPRGNGSEPALSPGIASLVRIHLPADTCADGGGGRSQKSSQDEDDCAAALSACLPVCPTTYYLRDRQ
ncbi:hypothetical protein P280DRAFT_468587 [Massarina eburnea CBS 473.64]|uniref:Uncharacterized protein n=1 Tax=Massarina eburnea CBS 473.64 TaxID=1395130 RepID=A0A6A6S4Q8_9PLEO|nr:hypothetical protein P280DRAFT_468587 [Massarina eburnea CBS 473.64]